MSPVTLKKEIHVGDTGTPYSAWLYDNGEDYDPTGAVVMQIIFRMPGGIVLRKDATLVTDGSPATAWYFTYTVQPNDGAGSPPGEFHSAPGRIKMQGYVEYANGYKWHSDEVSVDIEGRDLQVYENIED